MNIQQNASYTGCELIEIKNPKSPNSFSACSLLDFTKQAAL